MGRSDMKIFLLMQVGGAGMAVLARQGLDRWTLTGGDMSEKKKAVHRLNSNELHGGCSIQGGYSYRPHRSFRVSLARTGRHDKG
jgi:hypothetical protein